MFGRLAPYASDGNALDLSPLGEIGQFWLSELRAARRLRRCGNGREQCLRMRLDIVFTDASARAASFHVVNVDADLARQSADVGSSGDGFATLGAGHLFELRRHSEARENWLRLIGWKRLFFGFALGVDSRLESQARSVLSGNVLDGDVFRSFGLGCGNAFEREDNLADFDFLALLDANLFDDSTDR